jgi:hypothetical protein
MASGSTQSTSVYHFRCLTCSHSYSRPVFTYLKSRGFYAGVQVDGTVVIERTDENEKFYGQRIGVADILAGKVRHRPYEIKMLMETVKAAEGRTDVDQSMMRELEDQPAPADMEIQTPTTPIFGIPEPDDPDPFGVLALEKEGFEIREAGTKSRPPSTQFDFNPSPTSPIYSKFHRLSMDTLGTRSNRESLMSSRSALTTRTSTDRATQTADFGTQTEEAPGTGHSDENKRIVEEDERQVVEPEEIDYTKIDLGPYSKFNHSQDFDGTTVNESPRERDVSETHTMDTSSVTEDEDDEEPVIFEAASAQATVITPSAIKARGGLVNIPKRPPPPPLPPRSNARGSQVLMVDQGSGRSPMRSPTKGEFEEVDLHGVDAADRKRSEQPNGFVIEDSEKNVEPALQRSSLDEKVDEAFKHEEPEKAESINNEATQHESEEMHAPGSFPDDSEKFHSLPTTPLEVK